MTKEEREASRAPRAYRRQCEYPPAEKGALLMEKLSQNREFFMSATMQLYRSDFLRENGLAFYEGIIHEDNLFTITAALRAVRAGCEKSAYYLRRIRPGSIMTTAVSHRNVLGYYLTIIELNRLLNGVTDAGTAKLVSSKMNELLKTLCRWLFEINHAEKALVLASLTPEDRVMMQRLVAWQNEISMHRDRITRLLRDVAKQKDMNAEKKAQIEQLQAEAEQQKA